jgi:hypothetical protein
MTASYAKKNHLHGPKHSGYTDHFLDIVLVDNCHQYEMRCHTCGGIHVKWSSEWEYLWYTIRLERGSDTTFRQLYWAPRYDQEYQIIYDHVKTERAAVKSQLDQEYQAMVDHQNRFYEKHKD